jgi:hypothetical protein
MRAVRLRHVLGDGRKPGVLTAAIHPAPRPRGRTARHPTLPRRLTGNSHTTTGDGKAQDARAIPSSFDRVALLIDWVEKGVAPGKSIAVAGGGRSLPMCSYPEFPKYIKGSVDAAGSYQCASR